MTLASGIVTGGTVEFPVGEAFIRNGFARRYGLVIVAAAVGMTAVEPARETTKERQEEVDEHVETWEVTTNPLLVDTNGDGFDDRIDPGVLRGSYALYVGVNKAVSAPVVIVGVGSARAISAGASLGTTAVRQIAAGVSTAGKQLSLRTSMRQLDSPNVDRLSPEQRQEVGRFMQVSDGDGAQVINRLDGQAVDDLVAISLRCRGGTGPTIQTGGTSCPPTDEWQTRVGKSDLSRNELQTYKTAVNNELSGQARKGAMRIAVDHGNQRVDQGT